MLRNVTTILAALLIAVAAHAQSSRPQFEVASVKANTSGRNPSIAPVRVEGDRFVTTGASLLWILQFAYVRSDGTKLRYSDIIGAPAWANTDDFDIQAKAVSNDGPVSLQQMQTMVQSLLADRFQLKAHLEAREMPIFDLIVAKDGAKMKRATEEPPGKQQMTG